MIQLLRVKPLSTEDRKVFSSSGNLAGYVWRISGWHQVGVCLVGVMVALLGLVPIEIQRRIVNSLVNRDGINQLWLLCAIYLGVIVAAQLTNWLLKLYQGWLTQSATFRTREALLHVEKNGESATGRSVNVIGTEADKLGGFVGNQLSQASANIAILVGVICYMFVVAPTIALFSLAFLLPQVIIAPIVQQLLNKLVGRHIDMMRRLGDTVIAKRMKQSGGLVLARRLFRNRFMFDFLKSTMKATLNLINELAPLAVFLWGGYLVLQGEEEVGTLVAFVSGYQRLADPTRQLVQFYRTVAQTIVQHDMLAGWSLNRPDKTADAASDPAT